jgi:hypothetical protein
MLDRMTTTRQHQYRLNFDFIGRLRLAFVNPRLVKRVLTLVFLLLALLLAARWVSLWLAPRALASLPATTSTPPHADFRAQAAKVFGQESAAGTGLAGYSLAGVYATAGGDGVAVLVGAQKQLSARVGEEFAPGVRLIRLERGLARVSVNGREQVLQMPTSTAQTQPAGVSASGAGPMREQALPSGPVPAPRDAKPVGAASTATPAE